MNGKSSDFKGNCAYKKGHWTQSQENLVFSQSKSLYFHRFHFLPMKIEINTVILMTGLQGRFSLYIPVL